jgi:hypothetical protein
MLRVGGEELEKTMEDNMEGLGSRWPEHGFESLEKFRGLL